MEKSKKERMIDYQNKLEDVQNGLVALNEEIATLQIELLELQNNELEETTANVHSSATSDIEKIKRAIEKYQMEINSLE